MNTAKSPDGRTERDVFEDHACDDVWDIMGEKMKRGRYKNNFLPPSWEGFLYGFNKSNFDSMYDYAESLAEKL